MSTQTTPTEGTRKPSRIRAALRELFRSEPFVPTLSDARVATQNTVDWFQHRIDLGDPLLDQWMVDGHDAAHEMIRQLDKLEAAGIYTKKGTSR